VVWRYLAEIVLVLVGFNAFIFGNVRQKRFIVS